MDWERVKHFACAILSGETKEQLAKRGYFVTPTDEDAWQEALTRPKYYADEVVESDIQVSAPLPQWLLDEIFNGL